VWRVFNMERYLLSSYRSQVLVVFKVYSPTLCGQFGLISLSLLLFVDFLLRCAVWCCISGHWSGLRGRVMWRALTFIIPYCFHNVARPWFLVQLLSWPLQSIRTIYFPPNWLRSEVIYCWEHGDASWLMGMSEAWRGRTLTSFLIRLSPSKIGLGNSLFNQTRPVWARLNHITNKPNQSDESLIFVRPNRPEPH